MKRFLIVLTLLAFILGCAAKQQQTTETEKEKPRDSEIVKDIGSRGK